jgi:hypothetical protein
VRHQAGAGGPAGEGHLDVLLRAALILQCLQAMDTRSASVSGGCTMVRGQSRRAGTTLISAEYTAVSELR